MLFDWNRSVCCDTRLQDTIQTGLRRLWFFTVQSYLYPCRITNHCKQCRWCGMQILNKPRSQRDMALESVTKGEACSCIYVGSIYFQHFARIPRRATVVVPGCPTVSRRTVVSGSGPLTRPDSERP